MLGNTQDPTQKIKQQETKSKVSIINKNLIRNYNLQAAMVEEAEIHENSIFKNPINLLIL